MASRRACFMAPTWRSITSWRIPVFRRSMSPGIGTLLSIGAQTRHRSLVDIDAEPGTERQRYQPVRHRQRPAHDVFGEIEMGEADAPVDILDGTGEMHDRRRRETRFRHLGRDVDGEPEALAQRARVESRAEAAELDELERDPAGTGSGMGLDVAE